MLSVVTAFTLYFDWQVDNIILKFRLDPYLRPSFKDTDRWKADKIAAGEDITI